MKVLAYTSPARCAWIRPPSPPTGSRPPEIPANARVERFVPHGPILRRAAVTHGGAGITQKALAAGVPVCAVPFGRDQFEVARPVQVADAGARLPAAGSPRGCRRGY
jgi:UDP:flavonoid glycosyltransferase YjiC (YdhE family)